MRTQTEIVERYRRIVPTDLFGFRAEVLLTFLDFDHVREFLKEGSTITADEWNELATPDDEAVVLKEMGEYLVFAWGKAVDHRGISAGRSVEKLGEWLWLTGNDAVVAEFKSTRYGPYGAPQLAVVARFLEQAIPEDAATMATGEPCSADYSECVS